MRTHSDDEEVIRSRLVHHAAGADVARRSLSLLAVLALWTAYVRIMRLSPLILPTPYAVWQSLVENTLNGHLPVACVDHADGDHPRDFCSAVCSALRLA